MTIEQQIAQLRSLTEGMSDYTDEQLTELLKTQTVRELAHSYWTGKATEYAALVDVSESGSSRSMSQLHKNALTIADRFKPLDEQSGSRVGAKMTRAAVRS